MTSRAAYAVLASVAALAACTSTAVVRDTRVAIRQRTGNPDSALVVAYDANLCSLTFRDPAGTLVDLREADGKRVANAMTRDMPGPEWQLHEPGKPSRLFTVFAFPPGHYEIIELASTDDWRRLEGEPPPPRGHTDCDGELERRRVHMPFRIDRGAMTLIAIPNGPTTFDDLLALGVAAEDELIRVRVGSWYRSIDRARHARFRELVASQRKPRNGFDVYPFCNHKTAVVRTTGKPAHWESYPETGSVEGLEYRRPQFGIGSVHATGFGAGCVRKWAYQLMLSDASQVPAGTEAVGAWLVDNDIAGEIDLVVSGIPHLL